MAQEPVEVNETNDGQPGGDETAQPRQTEAPAQPQQRPRRPYQQNRGGQRGGQDEEGDERGSRRQGRYPPRRKVCIFCADKTKVVDWKRADQLRRFVGDSGEIYPRRKSGLCARHQRRVAIAIKRARHLAMLPFTSDHIRVMSKG